MQRLNAVFSKFTGRKAYKRIRPVKVLDHLKAYRGIKLSFWNCVGGIINTHLIESYVRCYPRSEMKPIIAGLKADDFETACR